MAETMINNAGGGGNNATLVLLASQTFKATTVISSDDFINYGGSGIQVVVTISAKTGSPTNLVVTLVGYDGLGNTYTILASAALTGTGTTYYTVFPGSAVSANVSANNFLPHKFKITVTPTVADADNYFTATVGANVLR